MAIEQSPELAAAIEQITDRWRSGDADGVIATMTSDPGAVMGGPGGSLMVGREQVVAFLEAMVPLAPGPNGGQVHFHEIDAWADGDWGWAYAKGRLRLADRELAWDGTIVARREDGAWHWVMFCAGPPGQFEPPAPR